MRRRYRPHILTRRGWFTIIVAALILGSSLGLWHIHAENVTLGQMLKDYP